MTGPDFNRAIEILSTPFEAGKQAALNAKSLNDNPHTCGFTKLGNVKLTEDGIEWQNGFLSVSTRTASKKEIAAAASVDVTRFRKRRQY